VIKWRSHIDCGLLFMSETACQRPHCQGTHHDDHDVIHCTCRPQLRRALLLAATDRKGDCPKGVSERTVPSLLIQRIDRNRYWREMFSRYFGLFKASNGHWTGGAGCSVLRPCGSWYCSEDPIVAWNKQQVHRHDACFHTGGELTSYTACMPMCWQEKSSYKKPFNWLAQRHPPRTAANTMGKQIF